MPAGQGDRQLDQPQGRRGAVPRAGAHVARYGAGVVVMAFDEQGQAETSSARSRSASGPTTCSRGGRLRAGGHRLRPERARGGTGIEEHDDYAKAFIEAIPLIKERCPGASPAAGSRTSPSRSAATTSSARRCTRRSSTTRSRPGSTWASSTRASSRSTRTSRRTCARRRGRALRTAGPDATERLVELAERSSGEGRRARARPRLARGAGREAARARARARDRRLRRGGHRGGAAAARGRST